MSSAYDGQIVESIPCPNCTPEEILKKYSNVKSYWEVDGDKCKCTNCGYTRPYIRKAFHIPDSGITKAQKKKLDWLKKGILENDGFSEKYEYKEWEVTQLGFKGMIQLVSVVGLKGDEGTSAEIFARTRRVIWIGVKGGMELKNAAIIRKSTNKKVFRKSPVYGRDVIWEITI